MDMVRDIARFNHNSTLTAESDSELLDVSSQELYQEFRAQGQRAIGTVKVFGSATFARGAFLLESDDVVFENQSAFTSTSSGVDVVMLGGVGVKYNVDGLSLKQVVFDGTTSFQVSSLTSWLTQLGVDSESNDRLIRRCELKPSLYTNTSPARWFERVVLDSTPEITRVRVISEPYAVSPDPQVRVKCATPYGAASSDAVALAQSALDDTHIPGISVTVYPATEKRVTLSGDVIGNVAQIEANIARELDLVFNGKIGANVQDAAIINAYMKAGATSVNVRYVEGSRQLTSGQSITNEDVFVVDNRVVARPL
jgi:hypothetical protein